MSRIQTTGNNTSTSSFSIPEVDIDPISPNPGDTWVLHDSKKGSPIGLLLSLTHSDDSYELSYRTTEGTTIRVRLT
jgi:hypothetical protein